MNSDPMLDTSIEGEKNNSPSVFAVRMVFFRTFWMNHYRGPTAEDKIDGEGGDGHPSEMLNFKPHDGKVYGFVRPAGQWPESQRSSSRPRIYINRLGAGDRDASVSGVLVIWIARASTMKKPRIVGWYRNATVHREWQSPPSGSGRRFMGQDLGFYATASAHDAFVVPTDDRRFVIPTGRDGIGQSNVWYADAPDGDAQALHAHATIRKEALAYITRKQPSG